MKLCYANCVFCGVFANMRSSLVVSEQAKAGVKIQPDHNVVSFPFVNSATSESPSLPSAPKADGV